MSFLKSKGEKVFFVLFLAFICAGAALLAAVFVLQIGEVNTRTITLSGTDTVKVNNNRILVRSAASSGGYYIYDNVTLAQLGARYYNTGWSSYHRFFLVGNLVYGTSAYPRGNMGTVEQ